MTEYKNYAYTWSQSGHVLIEFKEYDAMKARSAELEAVLRMVEWVPIGDECPWNECPWCHHTDYDDHASDCQRQKVLGEQR